MALPMAESLSSCVTLSDGVRMPLFGLGMSLVKRPEEVVTLGLHHGYRLVDTAVHYGNEEAVGKGIISSGIRREDVFVVSKVLPYKHGYDNAVCSVKDSLSSLRMKYIDLYLIHAPTSGQLVETYDALLEMKAQGYIRSVGVGNFQITHLEELKAAGRPLPSVNQIQLHPWYQQKDLVTWCRHHGVTITGTCPLVKGDKMDDPKLLKIAERYNKTPAQVLIRWGVQEGYIIIPRTSCPERLIENSEVFDWKLEAEDMELMRSWDSGYRCPPNSPWTNASDAHTATVLNKNL